MVALWKRLWSEDEGQGMAEYGLIIALVAIVVIGALTALGGGLTSIFGKISTAVGGGTGTPTPPAP